MDLTRVLLLGRSVAESACGATVGGGAESDPVAIDCKCDSSAATEEMFTAGGTGAFAFGPASMEAEEER